MQSYDVHTLIGEISLPQATCKFKAKLPLPPVKSPVRPRHCPGLRPKPATVQRELFFVATSIGQYDK